jgi:hypothetical protein
MTTNTPESTEKVFHQQLQACIEWMHTFDEALSEEKSHSYQDGIADSFIDDVLKLYLILQCYPHLKNTHEYQKFLHESIPFILIMRSSITQYEMDLYESLIPDEYYEAESYGVYWRRSAIQAIKEIYQDFPDPDLQYYLSSEDFECPEIDGEMVARHYSQEPEISIPIGMPRTHWWWGWTEYPNKNSEGE